MLKKVSSGANRTDSESAVMLEPRPGHTDEEVVERLRQCGATDTRIVTPGFVSARATRDSMRLLEEIADVQVKPTKQFRG